MMSRRVLAIVGVILSASASASAAATDGPATLFKSDAQKNPYAKLFTKSTVAPLVVQQVETKQSERPKVVCGMRVVPADGGVDPQMRKSPPERDNATYTIRAMKPPICGPE